MTSSLLRSVPSWNVTPSRSLKVYVFPSGDVPLGGQTRFGFGGTRRVLDEAIRGVEEHVRCELLVHVRRIDGAGTSIVPTTRLPPPAAPPPPLPVPDAVSSSFSLLPPQAATSSAATVSTITQRRFLRRPMDSPSCRRPRPGVVAALQPLVAMGIGCTDGGPQRSHPSQIAYARRAKGCYRPVTDYSANGPGPKGSANGSGGGRRRRPRRPRRVPGGVAVVLELARPARARRWPRCGP